MNPKTPLPWSDVPWTDEEEENLIDEKDVAFLVHAANAYPKLVEYAKLGVSELTSERAEQLIFEVEEFLKEIGE